MVPCPACAKALDPLRAGHVAVFGERFFFFCDRLCREVFLRGDAPHGPPHARASHLTTPLRHAVNPALLPPSTASETAEEGALPAAQDPSGARPAAADLPRAVATPEGGARLAFFGLLLGVLAVALALAGPSPLIVAVRIGFALLGTCAVAFDAVRSTEPTDAHPVVLVAPEFAAIAVAIYSWVVRDPSIEEAVTFAGLVVAATSAAVHLVERGRQPVRLSHQRIRSALDGEARRLLHGDPEIVPIDEVKAGEELVVEPGEIIPVDGTLVGGQAVVLPWLGASESAIRREGDAVVAGAKVVTGKARVIATHTGDDRAWVRLTLDGRRRADVVSSSARTGRMLADRGGLLALALSALAAFTNGTSSVQIALVAIAGYVAIGSAAVRCIPALHVARGILEGLRRGVAYRNARAWDRAADVSIAAFCARGTLLLGEPEIADLEAIGALDPLRVLALAAGAETSTVHPVALAVQRAAAARGVRPDGVRSPSLQAGLGVTAVASSGQTLVVGNRALMLREKISVAVAEQKIAEIEAHGRTALLVALAGKLTGVIGLQDGLRPGARAAVQHLLDSQVEPVLFSGDARETCEAIGRALDIEHIRPEILPADRALEIKRLSEGGMTVAVLGHVPADEAALGAADVAVALSAAGAAAGEWAVSLASDDVRDGALAVSLARRTRSDARVGLILALAPGVAAALAVAFGLVPPAYAPLSALLGAVVSTLHARASDVLHGQGRGSGRGADQVTTELALS